MKKHVTLLVAATYFLLTSVLFGCNEIGNGKVDPIEAVAIQAAVKAAFITYPGAVEPAEVVSTILLDVFSGNKVVKTDELNNIIETSVKELTLDDNSRLVFLNFITLVRFEIDDLLNREKVPIDQRAIVIKQLLIIIRDAANSFSEEKNDTKKTQTTEGYPVSSGNEIKASV